MFMNAKPVRIGGGEYWWGEIGGGPADTNAEIIFHDGFHHHSDRLESTRWHCAVT